MLGPASTSPPSAGAAERHQPLALGISCLLTISADGHAYAGAALARLGDNDAAALALQTALRLEPDHLVWGNPNRFDYGEITIRPDDRWHEGLNRRDRFVVSALTAPLLGRTDYSIRPSGAAPRGCLLPGWSAAAATACP